VAIALERSMWFLPAVLGCWRAGAAYLPIDPAMPAKRISFMLTETRAKLVLTDEVGADLLGFVDIPRVIVSEAVRSDDSPAFSPASIPRGLAYVIYTSGSRGTPKGVGVEHRQLFNYVHGLTAELRPRRLMKWATVSSFTTDLAHTGLFPPLATGGSAHVLPRDLSLDGSALEDYVNAESIDCLKIAPSHLAALSGSSRPLPRQLLILGGELLPWSLVERVHEAAPTCVVYNSYGPTETAVAVSMYRCHEPDSEHEGIVPIGRTLPNIDLALLDEQGQRVPPGDVGEIHIAGASVARGYIHRPLETAELFRPSTLSGRLGDRMYRTGDLARTLADKNTQFIGRKDDQVKVRGHRVELGEIEVQLTRLPEILQAVVLPRVQLGEVSLIACVVAREGTTVSRDSLRANLSEFLPEYMVPRVIRFLPRLPMLPSGKADRDKVGEIAAADASTPVEWFDAYEVTSSEGELTLNSTSPGRGSPMDVDSLEQGLLELFRRILGLPSMSPIDNFFDFGGDSLRAIRLIGEAWTLFGVRVPVPLLFTHPSPRELAKALADQAQIPHIS